MYSLIYTPDLFITLKLAGSSHVLTKFMDAQRRTALIFVTQGVGCASCMCDLDITGYLRTHTIRRHDAALMTIQCLRSL